MTSQDKAMHCSPLHRVYAWRERERQLAAGIAQEDEIATARAVTE